MTRSSGNDNCPICRASVPTSVRQDLHVNINMNDLIGKAYPNLQQQLKAEKADECANARAAEVIRLRSTIDETDISSQTLLHRASKDGMLGTVLMLLEAGADVHAKDNFGQTPLVLAAWKGHAAIVVALANEGADVNAKSNNGNSAIILAACNDHSAVVQILIERGALGCYKNMLLKISSNN